MKQHYKVFIAVVGIVLILLGADLFYRNENKALKENNQRVEEINKENFSNVKYKIIGYIEKDDYLNSTNNLEKFIEMYPDSVAFNKLEKENEILSESFEVIENKDYSKYNLITEDLANLIGDKNYSDTVIGDKAREYMDKLIDLKNTDQRYLNYGKDEIISNSSDYNTEDRNKLNSSN